MCAWFGVSIIGRRALLGWVGLGTAEDHPGSFAGLVQQTASGPEYMGDSEEEEVYMINVFVHIATQIDASAPLRIRR
jgi:hypothetical protein